MSKGPNGFIEANCLKEPNVCKVTKLCQEVIPSHSINTVKVPPSHLESWPTLIRIDKMNHIDVVEILTDAQWALQGVTMSYMYISDQLGREGVLASKTKCHPYQDSKS